MLLWEAKEYWLENKERFKKFLPILGIALVLLLIMLVVFNALFLKLMVIILLVLIGTASTIIYLRFGPVFDLITFVAVIATYTLGFWSAIAVGLGSIALSRYIHNDAGMRMIPYLLSMVVTIVVVFALRGLDIRVIGILAFIINNALVFGFFVLSGTNPNIIGGTVLFNALFNIVLFLEFALSFVKLIA